MEILTYYFLLSDLSGARTYELKSWNQFSSADARLLLKLVF